MTAARPLLLIEDSPSLQMIYRAVLQAAGHTVETASDAETGLAAFRRLAPDAVLLDMMLPDRDGLELMRDMLAEAPGTRVIVITSNGSINTAVEAMRGGAQDFLVKPFDEARFVAAVDNALRARSGTEPTPAGTGVAIRGMIGQSAALQAVAARIRSVARSMAPVFITGESGTGKALCAQAVHEQSPRARGPFIAIDCAAVAPDQLDSELFGHVRGAFASATADRQGAAVAADGGTLFLNEICEMDLALQPRFMRFLQTSSVTPLGSARPRKVDVRIICATGRDPAEAVRSGIFRPDLYFRLHVVPLHMPPLRDRGDDVIAIAESVLPRFAAEEGRRFTGLSPEVTALLRHLPWPGNVRQLLNVIRSVVVLHDGPIVTPDMLPDDLLHPGPEQAAAPAPVALGPSPPAAGLADLMAGKTLAQIEWLAIEAAIARNGGSLPLAARELGVAPSTLYRKRDARNSA